jgi:hypothetical protein
MNSNSISFLRRLVVASAIACAACEPAIGACTVATPPDGWAGASARWDGGCSGAVAEGLGVLKEYQGSAVKRIFFGRADKGELALGVIDIPDEGYAAGRFEHGKLVPTDDRKVVLAAFDAAAQAASRSAEGFDKAGNAESAKFYRAKAKAMREQMD